MHAARRSGGSVTVKTKMHLSWGGFIAAPSQLYLAVHIVRAYSHPSQFTTRELFFFFFPFRFFFFIT
ncbi:hypothetical protein F4802DRAFT_573477 [Xylaria palmicola]|nr:hypothetical protein F4802DRAFT_573477 [Xylaria palmicola]